MRFKLLRRRLSISAPRMIVRSHLPWPLRWAMYAVALGFSAAIALWAFEFGKDIAGLDRGSKEELARLRAEQELKQVKAEIRTDKLKKTATNAATAIASGVGSLFGSGKLKELEHHIEQLHQEITKRDKATDELKIQIQQIQEQHSRQIRNLQRIHNQELEAKDKELLKHLIQSWESANTEA